jgi:beta-galactosidase
MLTVAESPHSVRATIDRVVSALEGLDIVLFARIDHGGGARAAGLQLADEELLIFGDPRVGTLLMQGDPSIGYELPLRLLVWDDAGHTRIGYRPPSALADEYGVADHLDVLERMDELLQRIVAEGIAPA